MFTERRAADLLLLSDLPRSAAQCARAIATLKLDGVVDVVPSFDTIGIYFDYNQPDLSKLENLNFDLTADTGKHHRIPICYEIGPDFENTASLLAITPKDLKSLHSEPTYPCQAIGFCPGFAYLGPVDNQISGVPRLSSPRTKTEAGSLGLTGFQTAVYPLERPGGWPIIGKTPLTLVDLEDNYFPIEVGDSVTFFPIDQIEYEELKGVRL